MFLFLPGYVLMDLVLTGFLSCIPYGPIPTGFSSDGFSHNRLSPEGPTTLTLMGGFTHMELDSCNDYS